MQYPDTAPIKPAPENREVNILLVDDRPENLMSMTEVLASSNYIIVQANSGKEALRHILSTDFAVILLDVQMPDMDGFETASLIRSRPRSKHTPIIFITAVGQSSEFIERGYSLGAADYMLKPIVPEFLKTKVSVFAELFKKTETEKKDKERLKQLTEKLISSNAELEQFAYIASHDLQEPLRKIKNFAELFARRYERQLDEKADEFIHYITDGAERMQRLINGLLAYSRITSRKKTFEKVNFNQLVEHTVNMIQLKMEETQTVLTVDKLPTLLADSTQMGQVFQNLILNAIKFRGKNSPHIHISAEEITEKRLSDSNTDSANQDRKAWRFSLMDNGIGIAPKKYERIFILFQRLNARTEYPGEGMGLAICKKIVERHGGRIWVESKGKGMGSTFYFTLPLGG